MVKVKLNENYTNDFLTTHTGHIFYSKNNSLKKEWNEIKLRENDYEALSLISQGTLVIVDEKKSAPILASKIQKQEDEMKKLVSEPEVKEMVKDENELNDL